MPGTTLSGSRRLNIFVWTQKSFSRGTRWWSRRLSAARSRLTNTWTEPCFTATVLLHREDFRDYMFSLSQPMPEVLAFARALANSGKYFMGTINNESRELNLRRIEKYGLREIFRLFVSSCFVGLRKPENGIYRLAIETTQFDPEECCFIDDRALNLECAAKLGMRVIQMQTLDQLHGELSKLGVKH